MSCGKEHDHWRLEELAGLVEDALDHDADSQEIYETLIQSVQSTINHHEECIRRANNLLLLLHGREPVTFLPDKRDWDDSGYVILDRDESQILTEEEIEAQSNRMEYTSETS
tara:strand:+ start:2718 stop:3053 length:336 start_codon:yes stop_codon:yes gene_type:complete